MYLYICVFIRIIKTAQVGCKTVITQLLATIYGKNLRRKTFAVGIENDRSRENIRSSNFF